MKTISIENAKRLKELGVDVNSTFKHIQFEPGVYAVTSSSCGELHAYTADEMGDLLYGNDFNIRGMVVGRPANYICECFVGGVLRSQMAETMADAMALMLIWLIENGHVKADELK